MAESLLPLAAEVGEAAAAGRESLLVESYGHGFGTVELGRAVIKGRYKLIAYQNHESELYDLEADPYELVNLYTSSQHRDTVSDMEAELQTWLEKTGRRGFLAAGERGLSRAGQSEVSGIDAAAGAGE